MTLEPFASIFFLILGAIVGSFLNVVICRYNTGVSLRRLVGGRSQCLSCAKTLAWPELIPIFSFLAQRGRCRGCQSRFSPQYPLVELATALLFLAIWRLGLPPLSLAFYLVIFSLLVVIVVYDLRHKIIPDPFVYGFNLLALLHLLILSSGLALRAGDWALVDWRTLGAGLLAGGILATFFLLLWAGSRGRWMGFGDVKLVIGVGFLLGIAGGVSAIILAFWIGAVVGIALMLASKVSRRLEAFGMKSELPFAPFIILGLVLVVFYHLNVFPL